MGLNLMENRTGPWLLSDLKSVKQNGLKVFSCFHCGGGSTMGYKLAGYEVLGGVEIDKQMMEIYRANHNPKYSYLMGVQDFKKIPDQQLPSELFNLDTLDGSPPCSSFSMAGSREKAWGEKKKFREGQVHQVLDDLFFDFIDIAEKLKPKVVVAENVKGLIQGNARGYVKEIFKKFRDIGYDCQLFLLNAAAMGVPQKRERTFFIANKLGKKVKLEFNEKQISVSKSFHGLAGQRGRSQSHTAAFPLWLKAAPGESFSKYHPKGTYFNSQKLAFNSPSGTIIASSASGLWHFNEPRNLSPLEFCRLSSFPDDFSFLNNEAGYVCGMSVPPFMMQRVANQIAIQIFGVS